MGRSFEDARRWMQEGTKAFLDAIGLLHGDDWDAPSGLPSWTRRHLVAHIAANADAVGNLVHWAATGEETPMYSSPEARAEGIEKGTRMSGGELLAWVRDSAEKLEAGMAGLTVDQWQTTVVTAQGRTVPATETPWMRDREIWVHLVDLATSTAFADLPEDFLEALRADVADKRGEVPEVFGTLADVTAYLAGRPYDNVALANGEPAPDLGPWL
ncbi:maleylpyruvate isomerase family mycothiol-dependent enzyme [Actinomadura coerulea]|uniref:maleylpyruvate isomerase family mycothiol-dependent enzyme n=1 Tax=Actinomadura coerulea TaxID=46159 RepID=UPI003430BFD6